MELDTKTFGKPMSFECSYPIEAYKCESCPSFQTYVLASLKRHILSNHKKKNIEEVVIRCLRCPFMTFSRYLLLQHNFNKCVILNQREKPSIYRQSDKSVTLQDETAVSHHDSRQSSIAFGPKSSEKNSTKSSSDFITPHHPKPIDIKSLQFKIKQSLKSHTPLPHLDPPPKKFQWFVCDQCPRKFKTTGMLTRHQSVCHFNSENLNWFACDECPGKFKTNAILKRHISMCHLESKNTDRFKCDQCSTKFKQRFNLKNHIKRCCSNVREIRWLECGYCPLKFKLKSLLEKHVTYSHTNPEHLQLFKCDQCPSSFKGKYERTRHRTLYHSKAGDDQWFECDHCLCKFEENTSLKRHIKLCNLKSKEVVEWFECEQCPSKFKRKCSLQLHAKFRHSKPEDIQWVDCDQCSCKFKYKISLIMHKKSSHSLSSTTKKLCR